MILAARTLLFLAVLCCSLRLASTAFTPLQCAWNTNSNANLDATFLSQYKAGLQLAVAEGNLTTAQLGYSLSVLDVDASEGSSLPSSVIAMVGPLSPNQLEFLNTTNSSYGTLPLIGSLIPSFESFESAGFSAASNPRSFSDRFIQVRASLEDELLGLVDYVTRVRQCYDLSIFTSSNDPTDAACARLLLNILTTIRLGVVSTAQLQRSSNGSTGASSADIATAVRNLTSSTSGDGIGNVFLPQAVFLFGDAATLSSFVIAAKGALPSSTLYVATSLVGMEVFRTLLQQSNKSRGGGGGSSSVGDYTSNVVVSQVVPSPKDLTTTSALQVVSSFRTALVNHLTNVTLTSSSLNDSPYLTVAAMEGYITGKLFTQVAEKMILASLAAAPSIPAATASSRSNVFPTILSCAIFSVDGLSLGVFSRSCNQGMRQVYIGMDNNGSSSSTFAFPSGGCHASIGNLQKYFLFGQSIALSGPSAPQGRDVHAGVIAAFEEQNRAGGIYGDRLVLRTLDDGYDPVPAGQNAQALLQRNVFAVIATFGTVTTQAIAPVMAAAGIPTVGAITGAMTFSFPIQPVLREPTRVLRGRGQRNGRFLEQAEVCHTLFAVLPKRLLRNGRTSGTEGCVSRNRLIHTKYGNVSTQYSGRGTWVGGPNSRGSTKTSSSGGYLWGGSSFD